MATYILEKYAGMLTEEDVANLFDFLVKKLGNNRSQAARRCGLTGKATYDWEGAAYVKLGTKRKVLNASLEVTFLQTIEYLLGRSAYRSLDLLRTILSTLYADAIEAMSKEEFQSSLNRFETIKIRYQGMIKDGIQDEATDMSSLLRKKALDLGVPLRTKSINELSAEELVNAIQIVGHLYLENPSEAELFAVRDLGLPTDAVKPVIQTFRNLCFARKVQTSAITEIPKLERQPIIRLTKLFGSAERGGLYHMPTSEITEKREEESLNELATKA